MSPHVASAYPGAMTPGPAPTPTRLRLLTEHERDRRLAREPIPRPGDVDCPDDRDPEVVEVFSELTKQLADMQISAPSDRHLLYVLATAIVVNRRAARLVLEAGVLIKGRNHADRVVKNPAYSVMQRSAATVRSLSVEFGLSPSARSRIDVSAPFDDEDNPFAHA